MLHTTFAKLHKAGACPPRYKMLAKALGGISKYGRNTPIPLALILETNGLDDALWSIRATVEDSSRFTRLLACEFAEHILHLSGENHPQDKRPSQAIETTRRYANGQATEEELAVAWAAARAAAWAAERQWQSETFLKFLTAGSACDSSHKGCIGGKINAVN